MPAENRDVRVKSFRLALKRRAIALKRKPALPVAKV
jgi:hypothetical protein